MAKPKPILGRGLNALIPGNPESTAEQQPSRISNENILHLPLDSIIPNPRQPRRAFREDDPRLQELSASIKQHGLLQPLVVTRLDTGPNGWLAETNFTQGAAQNGVAQYQIIAGERRWRAARLAGLKKVPVVIKEATPQEMLELALIENIQRADLNPIEEALAYSALIEEYGMTQEAVARQVSKDRSTITNSLRLLQLAPKVREALVNSLENFTEGHARALVGITREEDQVAALGQIINRKLNVRQTEELAARIKAAERANANQGAQVAPTPSRAPDLDDLEAQFRTSLMVKVDLRRNRKGKGTLVLHFNNEDELERLYTRLVRQAD